MQAKALMQQQQATGDSRAAASQLTDQWLSRLRSMEQLLFSAQSVQFLDIRKREAEAFRVSCSTICRPLPRLSLAFHTN